MGSVVGVGIDWWPMSHHFLMDTTVGVQRAEGSGRVQSAECSVQCKVCSVQCVVKCAVGCALCSIVCNVKHAMRGVM